MSNGEKAYKFSKHARYQMQRRSITEEEVMACLNDYAVWNTDKKGNSIYRARLTGGRGIKVCVAEDDEEFIITVADY